MNISELIGKTLIKIEGSEGDSQMTFTDNQGSRYTMFHEQDCCESVNIDDITGDLNDLLNTPIVEAEERESDAKAKSEYDESYTWTFYHLATIKGYVTIKWYGTSNGYYSESVSFIQNYEQF